MTRQTKAGLICTALALCLIGYFTLRPVPEQAVAVAETSPWCIVRCGDLGRARHHPQHPAFSSARHRPRAVAGTRAAVAIGFLCSVAIELTQLLLIAGRDASLRDVITNTLGSGLGASLVTLWRPILLCQAHTASRLATIAGHRLASRSRWNQLRRSTIPPSVHLVRTVGTAAGTIRHLPGNRPRRPSRQDLSPSGILANGSEVRDTLLTQRYRLQASAVAEGSTEHEAPIFSIFDDQQQEILVLAQAGHTIHFRTRTRAADLELRSPSVRLEGFPTEPGTPVEITILRDGPRLSLSIDNSQGQRRWTSRTTVGSGWAMLLPWEYASGPEASLGSLLWLGGLLIPAGYWSGRCGAGRAMPLVLLAVIAAGLMLVPGCSE